MNSSTKLTINHLSKSFNDSKLRVLDKVSLSIKRGEVVCIIGPSGCGKSTLLDCIAGLTQFDGSLQVDGGTAYMFQDDVMFPWRSILDNVLLPLEIAGTKKDIAREEAFIILKEFGLEQFANYYPFQLSGGMRERAALARTYLCKKEVMLLDEPFSKLDALTRQQMQHWFLATIRKKKKTVLFVTHDVDEAIYLSDRVYVFSKRPGTVKADIVINIKKPRQLETLVSDDFISIKKRVLELLRS